jgi:hypothetical protein
MRWVLVMSAAALVLAAYYCAAEETPTAQVGDESRVRAACAQEPRRRVAFDRLAR